MTYTCIACTCIALALGACTYVPQTGDRHPDAAAAMAAAESLSTAGHYAEAAAGYASVASRFPQSRHAQRAAWSAAMLYSNPSNPEPDDSAAIHWFQAYQAFPLSADERRSGEACLFLLQRIAALKNELALKSTDASSRAQRMKDLDAQLRQVTEELKKMKEIDVKLHLRGGKK